MDDNPERIPLVGEMTMDSFYDVIDRQGYYIIAEAGVNYYEIAEQRGISPLEAAKLMAKEAHDAGADAIKFQTYKAEKLTRIDSPGSWDRNDVAAETMYELFLMYDHFGEVEYRIIADYCTEIEIEFMSTPFDDEAVDYLDSMMNVYKISSSDITNFPLITRIAKKGKPIVMSVGASDPDEIDEAINTIRKYNDKKLTILHCVLEYPTPYEHANLEKITTLRKRYPDAIIGYSDHTKPDPQMDLLKCAFTLGAQVIEKHYTLDKTIKGKNDHFHAMDPDDIRKLKSGLEFIKKAKGSDELKCLESEIHTRDSVRRSAVSRREIKKGEPLTEDMIIYKRPGDGISPRETEKLMGKKSVRDIPKDEKILKEWFI